jgi:hypothetical protein
MLPLPESLETWHQTIEGYWEIDPATLGTVPRITGKSPNRIQRLKAIGNGQVPLCAAHAVETLIGAFETEEDIPG